MHMKQCNALIESYHATFSMSESTNYYAGLGKKEEREGV